MKGLLLKDFYNMSGQIKLYVLYPVLGAVLSYMQQNLMMVVMLCVMMIVSIPISSFSYDDMADFTPMALTLPVSRKQVVLAKFALSFLTTVIAAVCNLVTVFILLQVFGNTYFSTTFQEQVLICLAACFTVNALNSIMIPVLYHFGTEKGRMFLFIIPFGVIGIAYLLSPAISSLSQSAVTTLLHFLSSYGVYIAALLVIFIEIAGLVISNRIMQRKEF